MLAPDSGDFTLDLLVLLIKSWIGHNNSQSVFIVVLVKDKAVYERMKRYITLSSIGVSKDTQLRALQSLKVVVGDGGR